MASNKKSLRNFIAVWDNTGLESIFDVDKEIELREQYEKNKIWNTLKEKPTIEPYKSTIPLQNLILRARYNSQRHYEIYQFVTDGLDMDDVKFMFETNPQMIVDHIRENGKKIYSDRFEGNKVLIT
jgi:hypothetical protein